MKSSSFLDVLGATGYKPRTLTMDLQGSHIFRSLPVKARAFLHDAIGLEPGPHIKLGQLYDRSWADDPALMRAFRVLTEAERTQVLGFVTFVLHEYTHHLDFLTTPFGLNFHAKTMREYWSMQDFAPVLLENPELIPSRFVDFDANFAAIRSAGKNAVKIPWYSKADWDSLELKSYWETLSSQILTFEAWGDASTVRPLGHQITSGWGGNTEPESLFGRELERVTVNGFLMSIRPQGVKDWYLRLLTLLETRALANSLRWILYLMGPYGQAEVCNYLGAIYRRPELPNDYLYLFDLVSNGFGYGNIESLAAGASREIFEQVLRILVTSCWFALQAPPPMDRNSVLAANPMMRLLLVLRAVNDFTTGRNRRAFESFVDLAEAIDRSDLARGMHLHSIKEILGFCREFSKTMLNLNEEKTWNPDVKRHFAHVLELLQDSLSRREGYTSFIGMPDHGNPFLGMQAEDARLLEQYNAPAAARAWFDDRGDILFVYHPSAWMIERLEAHFGMEERIIPCNCGAVISGRMSRFHDFKVVKCPQCGERHETSRERCIMIEMEAPTEAEEEYLNSVRQDYESGQMQTKDTSGSAPQASIATRREP
jgi:hypothetical protein